MGNFCSSSLNFSSKVVVQRTIFPSLSITNNRTKYIQEQISKNDDYCNAKLTWQQLAMKAQQNVFPVKELVKLAWIISSYYPGNRLTVDIITYFQSWIFKYLRSNGMNDNYIHRLPRGFSLPSDRLVLVESTLFDMLSKTTMYIRAVWSPVTQQVIYDANILVPDVCTIINEYSSLPTTEFELLIQVMKHRLDQYQETLELQLQKDCNL